MPERELVYNDANRLYQLIEDGTLTTAYLYNDGGQRTRKITYQSDGQTVDTITVYHYDMMGYLVTETTETGALIKDYIWREGMNPVAQIVSTTGAEQVSYLHTDHLMTNRLATNTAQQVVWRWEGEAFGNTPAQELASIQVNLRFPGQYYDAETNLHYNWNRYYDPELGRYITSDPIGLNGGMNSYLYAGANALMYYDPIGYWACKLIGTSDYDYMLESQANVFIRELELQGPRPIGSQPDIPDPLKAGSGGYRGKRGFGSAMADSASTEWGWASYGKFIQLWKTETYEREVSGWKRIFECDDGCNKEIDIKSDHKEGPDQLVDTDYWWTISNSSGG